MGNSYSTYRSRNHVFRGNSNYQLIAKRILYNTRPLFVMFNVTKFHMNFNFSIIVLCVFSSSTLIIVNPEISSMNGASTFINLFSFDLNTIHSFGKLGTDLLKKSKQQSHEFITPSNSNIFLMPKTKSTFSCISDTNVYISNLCPCMSTITGIINQTLTYCPFST